jgi:heterogeneous nuclear ribonucleoprotein F/H
MASGGGILSSSGAGLQQRGESSVATGDDPQPSGESATSSVAGLWSSGGDATAHSMQSFPGGGMGGPTSAAFDSGMAPGMIPLTSGGGSVGRGPPSSSRGGAGGALHLPGQKRTGGGIQVGDHTGFLRMRGLPFSATKEDIYKFFLPYNPVPDSIVLTYRNDGRATGEAYIEFASQEDSKRAMELHRRIMGNRYIELFISNKDEQGRALARFGGR